MCRTSSAQATRARAASSRAGSALSVQGVNYSEISNLPKSASRALLDVRCLMFSCYPKGSFRTSSSFLLFRLRPPFFCFELRFRPNLEMVPDLQVVKFERQERIFFFHCEAARVSLSNTRPGESADSNHEVAKI